MKGYDKYLEFQYRQTGGFYTNLFRTIQLADESNLRKLSLSFHEEVDAFKTWTRFGVEEFLEFVSPNHRLRERFIKEYDLEVNDD